VKAVSPLVATALLLIITVAGGIIVYNYVVNSLSSAQQYASLSIASSKMVILTNTTVVNIKITNIGTASANVYMIRILPYNLTERVNLVVEPGITKSVNIFINQTLDPDQKYYVVVVYDGGETEPYPISLIK